MRRHELTFGAISVVVHADPFLETYAGTIWQAAHYLCAWLCGAPSPKHARRSRSQMNQEVENNDLKGAPIDANEPPPHLEGMRVIELGAGTGICGICAGKLGADVVLTDLPHVLPQLNAGILSNDLSRSVKAEAYAWGSSAEHLLVNKGKLQSIDVIIMSDVFYDPQNFENLMMSLELLFGETTVAFLAFEKRINVDSDTLLKELSVSYDCKTVLQGRTAQSVHDDVFVFSLRRRPDFQTGFRRQHTESRRWTCTECTSSNLPYFVSCNLCYSLRPQILKTI
jgi:hypothetical protein